MPWRAWYSDGSEYASDAWAPSELPDDGLLGIVEYLPGPTPKRYIHTGHDRYFWYAGPRGLVIGGNSDSPAEIERRYPGAVVVRGKWTTHADMKRVREAMQAAHDPPDGS